MTEKAWQKQQRKQQLRANPPNEFIVLFYKCKLVTIKGQQLIVAENMRINTHEIGYT